MKLTMKLLVLVLAVLMCVGCFASCGGSNITTTSATTTTPPSEVVDPDAPHQVTLLNDQTFSGKTCTIYYKSNGGFGPGSSLWVEEPGVSAVDRASYKRLQTIKERTGVNVFGVVSQQANVDATSSGDIGYLRELFSTNDPEQIPDIVMPGGYASCILASEGLFLDLGYDNPYIDLSLDCWQQNINDALSVCGTYYTVSGLSSINNIRNTTCIFFDNTALGMINTSSLAGTAADGFEDASTLYEWTRSGEWTYKKLLALAVGFASEEGSVADPDNPTAGDIFGFEYQSTSSYCIFMSTGKKYVTGDPETTIPTLMIDEGETMKVLNWLVDNVATKPYVHTTGAVEKPGDSFFGLSHGCLFRANNVSHMASYSALGADAEGGQGTFDFGILPMPKFDYEDVAQDSYYCAHNAWYSALAAIPKNCADTAFSSFVLELITEMGYYAWEEGVSTIWSAYIEDGLQGRYAPNIEDEEMLNIVLQSAASDMGEFNVWEGINIANEVRGLYNSANKNWEGWSDSKRDVIDSAILKMLSEMGLITFA